jgi:hypothetical protein
MALGKAFCRVSDVGHSAKEFFARVPDVGHSAIFKTLNTLFAECMAVGTRQRLLCRVSDPGHSAKCIF